jgi:hypothetical protein
MCAHGLGWCGCHRAVLPGVRVKSAMSWAGLAGWSSGMLVERDESVAVVDLDQLCLLEKSGQAPAVFGRLDPVALRPDDECGLAEAGESFGGAAQQVLAGEDGAEHADRVAADAALGEDWFQAVARHRVWSATRPRSGADAAAGPASAE